MFCTQCGAETKNEARFCSGCGAALNGTPTAVIAAAVNVPIHAGFWRRYAAAALDITIIGLLCLPFILYDTFSNETIFSFFTTPLIILTYFVLSEGLAQTTAGKRAVRIKVTNKAGGKIGLGRSVLRFLGKLLMIASLGIGFIIVAFTTRRQALDDFMAGTLVVSKDATPTDIIRAPFRTVRPSGGIFALAGFLTLAIPTLPILLSQMYMDTVSPPIPPDNIAQRVQDLMEFRGTVENDEYIILESQPELGYGEGGTP